MLTFSNCKFVVNNKQLKQKIQSKYQTKVTEVTGKTGALDVYADDSCMIAFDTTSLETDVLLQPSTSDLTLTVNYSLVS